VSENPFKFSYISQEHTRRDQPVLQIFCITLGCAPVDIPEPVHFFCARNLCRAHNSEADVLAICVIPNTFGHPEEPYFSSTHSGSMRRRSSAPSERWAIDEAVVEKHVRYCGV